MGQQPDFSRDIDTVLDYLRLGERTGLGSLHRAQDLQSWLLHREAVRILREDPAQVQKVEATLARWTPSVDPHSRQLLERWTEIIAARDWDAALANTDQGQQLRQAPPLAGLLPEDTRLAIIRYVRELVRAA